MNRKDSFDYCATHLPRRQDVGPKAYREWLAIKAEGDKQLADAEKADFKRTRFLWLKNPENLAQAERTRLSTLLRINSPIVKAYLLKEDLRRFWSYRYTAWAGAHLLHWLWRASHSRLEPLPEVRPDAARSSRWRTDLDEAPSQQRCP